MRGSVNVVVQFSKKKNSITWETRSKTFSFLKKKMVAMLVTVWKEILAKQIFSHIGVRLGAGGSSATLSSLAVFAGP